MLTSSVYKIKGYIVLHMYYFQKKQWYKAQAKKMHEWSRSVDIATSNTNGLVYLERRKRTGAAL
jgi:hypothetical protein